MVSLSSKGTTFLGLFGLGRIKLVLSSIFLKNRLVTSHLIFSSFLPSTFNAKISDSSSEISASDSSKLCRSASFGSTHNSLLWCLPYFGFPRIRFLFNSVLFYILGIRYGLCTRYLNTDRGEAARFQKLPTSIKRQYNSSEVIIPKMKRTDDCMFLPLAKKQYSRDEYSGTN